MDDEQTRLWLSRLPIKATNIAALESRLAYYVTVALCECVCVTLKSRHLANHNLPAICFWLERASFVGPTLLSTSKLEPNSNCSLSTVRLSVCVFASKSDCLRLKRSNWSICCLYRPGGSLNDFLTTLAPAE